MSGDRPTDHDATDERTAVVRKLVRVYNGFLKIDKVEVSHQRYDGDRQTVTRESMERGDSVAVVMVDRARRKVLLLEQFRYPTLAKGPGWIEEIPAGMPKKDETAESAATREILEETGFSGLLLEHVSTFYVSPGGTSERIILYCAFYDGLSPDLEAAKRARDADEDIKPVEIDLEDFLAEARLGRLPDAKTLIAGLWLQANRTRMGL